MFLLSIYQLSVIIYGINKTIGNVMIWGILTAAFVWFFFFYLTPDEDDSDEF